MRFLFFAVYGWIIGPIASGFLPILALFVPKIKAGLELRRKDFASNKSLKSCIWIHVSSGEWEYAKPVARLLKARGEKILVTHFSPSVRKSLENSPDVDVIYALPLDTPWALEDFFKRFQPKILLLARTDLWPLLLKESKKRGITNILFSATLSGEMLQKKNFFSRILSQIKLFYVDEIFCVSSDDEKNLSLLVDKNKKVNSIGDTRFDQAIFRLANAQKLKPVTNDRYKYFVCGSTWPADEAVLLPVIQNIQNSTYIRFILAPHEPKPSHLQTLQSQLKKYSLTARLYSQTENSQWSESSSEILLVDQVGILAELYLQADYAFVGNSFETHAVHSVMEPLAAGCLTFVGPFHKNNREAIEFAEKSVGPNLHAVESIRNSQDLVEKLQQCQSCSPREIIRQLVKEKAGATARLRSELSSVLNQNPNRSLSPTRG